MNGPSDDRKWWPGRKDRDVGEYDVIVAGAGNAALCAAISAHENGARVLVLERAPEAEKGGNSYFTAGGFRFVHEGADDIASDVIPDLTPEERGKIVHPAAHTRILLQPAHGGHPSPVG